MQHISTFSLVAYDPDIQAWGVAVASKFPAVGAVVPWVEAGAGAVATQSFANTRFGPDGLEWMRNGMSAEDALGRLLQQDKQATQRQVGLVDAAGQAATFTGEGCYPWAGGRIGKHHALQGNILTGRETLEAMEAAYLTSEAPFPERMLAALLAGDRAGGDRRGKQSAALYIARAEAGYGGFNDRWIDYRVDDHPDPIPQLGSLLELHRLFFEKSAAEDELPLTGEVLKALIEMLEKLEYLPTGLRDREDAVQQALAAMIGNENFEDRTDLERGVIDRPVYEYLQKKFG